MARSRTRCSGLVTRALVLVIAAAGGCTSSSPHVAGSIRSRPAAIGGRLLLASGNASGTIWSISLPSSHQVPIQTPKQSGYISALVWGPNGRALSVMTAKTRVATATGETEVRERCCTLFALSETQEPKVLTVGLRAISIQLAGGGMLAALCGRAAISAITPRPRWRTVPTGNSCTAALSPDARWIAYDRSAANGGAIWRTRADGSGTARRVVSLASIPQLSEAGLKRPVVIGAVAWGEPGIGFIAGSRAELNGRGEQGNHALVVVSPTGHPKVFALGSTVAGQVAWQPGGRLLAFTDVAGAPRLGYFSQSGYNELRVLDAGTWALRELATAPVSMPGTFSWRSDGKAIAWTQASGLLRLLSPNGSDLGSVSTEGIPYDWAA